MAEEKQRFKLSGRICDIKVTNGTKNDGSNWERAAIKIEMQDNKSATVSTFNGADIAKANSLYNKHVEVVYTKSPDGKYKNLEKAGITEVASPNALPSAQVVEEEIICESQPVPHNQSTPQRPTTQQKPIQEEFSGSGNDSTMSKADWDIKDMRKTRSMILSYIKDKEVARDVAILNNAKELIAQRLIEPEMVEYIAKKVYQNDLAVMMDYVWSGKLPQPPKTVNHEEIMETIM